MPIAASGRKLIAMVAAGFGCVVALAPWVVSQQIQIQAADQDPYKVYLPADRTLSRGMSRAELRLAEREYNEALAFLQKVLDQEEDTFLDDDDPSAHGRRGLKATARHLIATMPSAGRDMYELLHSSAARRALDSALTDGDREALATIVRRYLYTPAGNEAALILAQSEFDRGRPLAAAYIYDQLLEDPRGAAGFEPQLSVLTAVCWAAAGQPDRAARVLRNLTQRSPETTIELAGRKAQLPSAFASNAELVSWLTQTVGVTQLSHPGRGDWLTQRGNLQRNAEFPGGAPHLSARWEARVVNDPRYESFLMNRGEQFQHNGVVAIPAARPIAIDNIVLMRTPQNLVAVDWTTGKRVWETREDKSGHQDRFLAEVSSGQSQDQWPVASHPLEERVWDDSLSMSISSDSERVYAINNNEPPTRDENPAWGLGVPFGGPFDMMSAPSNRLTAYELATEGKLAWEIDGANDPGEFSGAFFLGAPLAVDGSLYVLAEIRSAIYLLAIDPQSGALEWQQQLAGLEQGITLDPQRRLTTASPSYASGILVCPTTAGIVVAVDVVQREFAWVYRYPRQVESFTDIRTGWRGRRDAAASRENSQWLDSSVVIDDGHVFLTPPESTELHCLDLTTGQLQWKRSRDKALYLACVDQGNVLLVGVDGISAVKAEDGSQAWSMDEVELATGVVPSGTGYLSEGRYYLPLSSGQVFAIDPQDGSTFGPINSSSGAEVGNLICHRGSIISQSALMLDKFDQIEMLRKQAEAALAQNPRDAAAIRDLAEMRHLDGELAEAVRMLRQAHEIDPEDPVTREMLAECLLDALAADYAKYQDDLPLLRQIADQPQQQIELLRLEAAGLEVAQRPLEAFAKLLQIAESTATEPVDLIIEPGHTVRSDAWIRSGLNRLFTAASADDRATMASRLSKLQSKWTEPRSTHALHSYLAFFDGLPGADEIRLQLVRQLIDERELLDAEIELLKLESSTDQKYRAAAAVLTTEWLLVGNRVPEARQLVRSMANSAPEPPSYDGKTPQQLLDEWRFELTGEEESTFRAWPRGQVLVDVAPTASPARREITRRAFAQFQQGMRKLRVEQVYRRPSVAGETHSQPGIQHNGFRLGASQWLISQDATRLVGRNGIGIDTFRFSPNRESAVHRIPTNSDWVQAAQLGDLLYVTTNGQIVALDTRRLGDDEADVIWQAYPSGQFAPVSTRGRIVARARSRSGRGASGVYHPWSERKRAPDSVGSLIGSLGPVTPYGVILQEQRQIRCVEPITGETIWARTDLPTDCELFGDDEFVLATDKDESQIYLIDFRDGTLVGQRDMPAAPWLLTSGRNVCQLSDDATPRGPRKRLRIVDVVSGEVLLEADFGPNCRMTTLEPDYVAVVESTVHDPPLDESTQSVLQLPGGNAASSSGRFDLINVQSGKRIISESLERMSPPRSVHLLEAGRQLFLVVNGGMRQQPSRPIGIDYPLADGEVYAFDLTTGQPVWPGPAVVDRRGISLTQPDDIPLLVFVDRVAKRDAGGGGSQLRLLCLDKQTGATLYRNDSLPDTSGSHFRIFASRGDPQTVTVEMSTRTVLFTFTEEPRAPKPPANDFVEAPRKSLGRGLWGVGQRMGDMIQGAIQNPGGANWQTDDDDANDTDHEPIDDD